MKVKALVSFVSNFEGQKYRVQAGHVVEMPKGADWLRAGLVTPAEPQEKPTVSKRRSKK